MKTLRHEKREQYHRHASLGDLITDRWEIALTCPNSSNYS
jgi:hypothetical protein